MSHSHPSRPGTAKAPPSLYSALRPSQLSRKTSVISQQLRSLIRKIKHVRSNENHFSDCAKTSSLSLKQALKTPKGCPSPKSVLERHSPKWQSQPHHVIPLASHTRSSSKSMIWNRGKRAHSKRLRHLWADCSGSRSGSFMSTLFGMIKSDRKLLCSGANPDTVCKLCHTQKVGVRSVKTFVDELQAKFQWSKSASWLREYNQSSPLSSHFREQLSGQGRLSRGIRNRNPLELVQSLCAVFEKALLDVKE